jgi:GNAT superfamily N-acetyltransferase
MRRIVPVDVTACEENQADWYRAQSRALGGAMWREGSLEFIAPSGEGEVMLAFPTAIGEPDLRAGVQHAWDLGYTSVGAWLGETQEAGVLEAFGFERGWAPWWMAARLDAVPRETDPRVHLEDATPEYDEHGRRLLAMTAEEPRNTWHAVARVDGQFAGRAWLHGDGRTAGIYDMEVWPKYRQSGLGSAILAALAPPALAADYRWAVLNATPEGERLYSARGFRRIGDGATWWLHRS